MSRSQEYNEQGYDVPFVDEHGNPIPDLTDNEEKEYSNLSIEQINEKITKEKAEQEAEQKKQAIAELKRLKAQRQRPAPVDDRMVVHNSVQPMVMGSNVGHCGQRRVERQQFASPVPVSLTPELAAAFTSAQRLLKIQEDKFDFEMRQKFANAEYQAAMSGPAPAKTVKAPVQQQRQRSTQPSRRQQNNRGRQPTPFRGSGFRYQPRSSQWVAPGYRQAHYVPVQRSGPREPKIEKKVSQTRSRQANDKRQDQVLRGLGGLFEQRATLLQPQQQEKAEDLGDEGSIKEEPQDAAADRPIKKERADSGDERE
ncbi:MAG: hypothetical protein L6R38_005726 [Xanthoria sp. 2 TBL-2021]|nr:MAG: hypothetical protein L6R38_005726 [Xanthoria sp. 2 TBL-2021]